MNGFRTVHHPASRKPRVYKQHGYWIVERPHYHTHRCKRWADALGFALDWWCLHG